MPEDESVSEFVNQNREEHARHPEEHFDDPYRHFVDFSDVQSRNDGGDQPKKRLDGRRKTKKIERNVIRSRLHRSIIPKVKRAAIVTAQQKPGAYAPGSFCCKLPSAVCRLI
jgi:hypothetical protein